MAQTATSILDLLREAWTSSRIVKQFEDGNGPLARIQKVKGTMIGAQAQVPLHTTRNFAGFTTVGASGGDLNAAGAQGVDQAVYTLAYQWLTVELDTSALLQAQTDAQSIMAAKDLEIEGGLENIRHQCVRQLMTAGDSVVAACDTGGPSTTVELLGSPSGTAYGYDALVRGWFGVGSVVDIGDYTSNSDSVVGGATISAYDISDPANPSITIDSSVSTTSGTDFVTVANPNSGTAVNPEINGLRNMISTTSALGSLDPQNAGEEFWSSAEVDTSTTVFSLDLALSLSRFVRQFGGKPETDVWTGLKQMANFYSLLQNQVRFTGDTELEAGSMQTVRWNGMKVDAFPDVLDSDWYAFTLSDLCRITGASDGPKWASEIEGGGNGQLRWNQNTTKFRDAVVYPIQVGMQRRNTSAAATGLTA